MKRFVEWFNRRAAAELTLAVFGLAYRMPLPVCRAAGRVVGRCAYYVAPRVRSVAVPNAERAFYGERTRAECKAIVRESLVNIGQIAFEFAHIRRMDNRFRRKYVVYRGLERLDRSRGAVFFSGHVANWEWICPLLAMAGLPVTGVVRPLNDSRLDAAVTRTRRTGGAEIVPKENAGRVLLRRLKQGGMAGIMVDQSPRDSGVPTTFFGLPCWATAAPVMMAIRAGVPMHPVSMHRTRGGKYVVEVHDALPLLRTGDLRRDLVENTQRIQDVVESHIRRNPGQWLWVHRRWKRRERLEAQWSSREVRLQKIG